MEDDENVYNLSGFQVVDEWSESEEDDDLSTKNDSFRNDETKKPSEGEIDAFLENVKSNVTTQDFKKKPKRNSEKQASLISKHNRPSLDHRREKNHREPRHDRAMLEERRVLRRSRSRENTRKKIHPSLPRKKIRSTSPRKKNPTPPRKHNLSASRRDYVGDSSSSFRPEMGLVDQFRDKMNMFGMQPFPNYDDNRQNFKQLPPPSTHHNYHPEYYPYVPGVDVAQPNPNFTNMGPYPINNAGHGMYKNFQSYGNSMEQPMMPGYDPYSQNQPYNPVQGYPGHMANPQPNTCYPTQQGVPGYLPCNSISMNTYQDSNTLSTTPAHAINPDYRLGEQYSLSNMDLHKKVVQTSKSKHHYNMPSPHGKEGKAARWNRSRSRSNDSSTSDERKSKRHSRSPAYPSLKTKRKYSISPPKSSKTSKIVIDPTRIPTPPPPPILSNYNNRDKRNIENNKITVEAKGKTQEAQVSKIVGTSNVSLSCLLEAVMESSGQGKSKVSDPSVKKKILYQCENKIRLMYKKRLSGLGAFIPEPVEEVMINNSSSPLIVHHPYLSYNQGSEKVIWKCLGIKIPSVKKISSTKYVENLQKNPSLIDSWGLPERSFSPHVSASYPQFDKNVQVGGINETISNMPYEQLNKNLQVAGSNVHFPSIPHKQLLPSTYPVLQHNSPACLGSYNQPTWQEIPATHQHNYMLSYPLHPSQPKSQYFPEVIRDLTYPISATNLFHPFDDTKGSTQSSISPLMSIDCLNPSQQSDIVFEGKIPGERNVINSNLQRNSKSLSSKRRPRSRIPLSPRRSKSPLSPGRRSKSPLSPTRRTISPLSRRRRSKSPLSSRRRSKSLLSSRRTRSPLSSGRPRSPSSRRSRSPLSPRKNKRSSPIGRIRRENHSPLEVEDTGKSDPNVVNRKAQRKAKQLSYKNLVPIVADNNFHNAPQTQAGDSVVQSKNIVEVIMGTSNMQSNAEDRKEKSELSGQKRNYESFISDKTTESNVQDKVISESNDNLYEVVSQNSGNLVVYVPTSTCKSEDDIKNLSTMKSIADFEFQGISFMDFCRRVGTEIGKLQEKSSTCSGIIASLKEGAKTYKRAYILKDGVLCKKFPLLRIMIPEEYLVDSILVLHQQFHFATQEDICQVIDNYTYPGLNFEKANVKRAFDECTQCIESKKCRLTDDKNSEETIQSKRTTKEVVNLDKQTVYVIGEQNIADSGCVKNIDNADQLSVNTFHNETEETVDSSLGGKPYEYEKETEKKSETLEHNNKCCVNENPNESSNDNLISTTTESSSSTLKNRDETAQDLNQNTSATTRENNDVGIVEKSSEIRDQSDSNQPKGGLDFKTQVRAVQLKCKQLNERLVSLKAGESSDEKYLLKGGMLCEKVQTADTVEIKIVAPLSEVDSIISIVHTMPKTHTPENILIAFFLKHFTYIPELNEKVKKIVGACSICST